MKKGRLSMKGKLAGIGTILVLGGLLAGCGNQASGTSRTLNVTSQANVLTLDPSRVSDVGSDFMLEQTLDGLYKTNNKGTIVPALATKIVKPMNDGKTYTFELRKDAKWDDGSQVTANDFVVALQRQVNPKTKSQRAQRLQDFVGYKNASTGKAKPSTLGVKALGKYKLQIQLTHAVPYFDYILASQIYPVNIEALNKWGSKYDTDAAHAVSNSAYKIKDWNSSKDSWNLEKNKQYYDADKVKIKKINFQVVKTPQTGLNLFEAKKVQETQISGNTVAMAAKQYKDELVRSKYGQLAFLPWSNTDATTKNQNLRKAVSAAIDREDLVKNVLKDGSIAAKSIVPEGEVKQADGQDFNAGVGDGLAYNPTQAKADFAKAQQELGKKTVNLEIVTADTDAYKQVGEYLQGQLEKQLPGLKVTIKTEPLSQEVNTFSSGNFQTLTMGWSTDYPDPIDYLNIAADGGTINFTKWHNAEYQKLIDQINDTDHQTAAQRVVLQQKAAKLLNAEQGVTPLYQYASVHLRSTDLKGLEYPLIGYQRYEYVSWK